VHRNLRGILAKLPKTLDETYERVLREINEENRDHARRLLHCLAVAIRPLRVEELAEILAMDFDNIQGSIPRFRADWRLKDQEEAVLSTCSSLISVVDCHDRFLGTCRRVVQFSHFSVEEFLMSDRLASSAGDVSPYHILPGPAHIVLTQACLGLLLHLDTPTDKETGKRFPLAGYAARYWIKHAQFEHVAPHVKDGMRSLFDPDKRHLEAWVGIYDVDFDSRSTLNPLYYAALCGFYDLVEHLVISHPQLINTAGGRCDFPVVAALSRKHTRVAEYLIRHGGKLDIWGADGTTPLQTIIIGHRDVRRTKEDIVNMVSFLLKHGADVNFRGSHRSTPLHNATFNRNFEVVQLLLKSGADFHSRNHSGKTPLHMVLEKGRKEAQALEAQARQITRLLLERGANVNVQDNNGATPLQLAAYNGYDKISQILLMHGAEPNVQDDNGRTALHRSLACYRTTYAKTHPRHLAYDVAQILLEHGAKPNLANNCGETPLHLAFDEPRYMGGISCRGVLVKRLRVVASAEVFIARLVSLLLEHGADVNVKNKGHTTPLLLTIQLKMYEITRVLLARGAEANVANDRGKIPLHLLLEDHFSDKADISNLVRLLLDSGADVNIQDENHATPLWLAVKRRKNHIARILLEHGADPNVKNIRGKTPLHLLLLRTFSEHDDINDVLVVERLLLERGADVNAQDKYNTTPLHLASNHHIPKVAQIILDRANLNAENDRRTGKLHVTLEGEYSSRTSSQCFTVFTRTRCTHGHPGRGPHSPPTFGMLLWEARDSTGDARSRCSIKR
jgi:ankyrin repeat protein